jgi:hypothetical protein
MAVTTGMRLGKALCEAVGVDPVKVVRLELVIDAAKMRTTLTIETLLSMEQEAATIRLFELADWREPAKGAV